MLGGALTMLGNSKVAITLDLRSHMTPVDTREATRAMEMLIH